MTLLPLESWAVVGVEGDFYPRYRVGPLCSAPGCSRFVDHTHHIWRRSFLVGDYAWVRLPDGQIVGNLAGLCYKHHESITVNREKIAWNGEQFIWEPLNLPLHPHPPVHGRPHQEHAQPTLGPAAVESCPECHRPLKKAEKGEREPAKRRKTWTVTVPAEAEEDGHLVLATLLEECRKLFGHDDKPNARYFTLCQALALVVQHGPRLVRDE